MSLFHARAVQLRVNVVLDVNKTRFHIQTCYVKATRNSSLSTYIYAFPDAL